MVTGCGIARVAGGGGADTGALAKTGRGAGATVVRGGGGGGTLDTGGGMGRGGGGDATPAPASGGTAGGGGGMPGRGGKPAIGGGPPPIGGGLGGNGGIPATGGGGGGGDTNTELPHVGQLTALPICALSASIVELHRGQPNWIVGMPGYRDYGKRASPYRSRLGGRSNFKLAPAIYATFAGEHNRNMNRREVIKTAVASACAGGLWTALIPRRSHIAEYLLPPAYSVIPVVGDGKWIWKEPPEGETGYLEPRSYDVSVGIEMTGTGSASDVIGTTVAPLEYPEQKILESSIETSGCQAQLRKLAEGACQLVVAAAEIAPGQVVRAVARFQMTLFKQFFDYHADMFPARQELPPEVRKKYLQDSPGIQVRSRQVRSLAAELTSGTPKHPYEQARAFAEWITANIKPQIGNYTSVTAALDNHRGDCEEMSAVFVAVCRATSIPARLVWIPNHNWAEFYLTDRDGQGRWIPAHTACYPWFGFTGAHELVLQKGDRVMLPEKRKQVRLVADWLRYSGSPPKVRYTAELTPLADDSGGDVGPGARQKDAKGEWQVVGDHPLDKLMRR